MNVEDLENKIDEYLTKDGPIPWMSPSDFTFKIPISDQSKLNMDLWDHPKNKQETDDEFISEYISLYIYKLKEPLNFNEAKAVLMGIYWTSSNFFSSYVIHNNSRSFARSISDRCVPDIISIAKELKNDLDERLAKEWEHIIWELSERE